MSVQKKILEEIDERQWMEKLADGSEYPLGKIDVCVAKSIVRKNMRDYWIPIRDMLPEDVYTSSELDKKWFLITTPCGEGKLVKRMRCVPAGYVWHDGYDTHRAIAWRYVEPYNPERSEGE